MMNFKLIKNNRISIKEYIYIKKLVKIFILTITIIFHHGNKFMKVSESLEKGVFVMLNTI